MYLSGFIQQVKASEAAEPDEQEDIRVRKEIRLYRCSDQVRHIF